MHQEMGDYENVALSHNFEHFSYSVTHNADTNYTQT